MGTSRAEQAHRRLVEAGPLSVDQLHEHFEDIDRAREQDSNRYAAVELLKSLGWLALGAAVVVPIVRFWILRGCPVWALGDLPICR